MYQQHIFLLSLYSNCNNISALSSDASNTQALLDGLFSKQGLFCYLKTNHLENGILSVPEYDTKVSFDSIE
jgi:hypothetical protein